MFSNRKLDLALLIAVVGLFVIVRIPLYVEPGLRLGWNSDGAIFGLIAREIASGGVPIWFFWGQDYLGTLTSFTAALAGLTIGEVGPLALRVAAGAEIVIGILFFWDALRCTWGRVAAHLAAAWLAAGPFWLFKLSAAPNAGQMFLIGSCIFWFVARRRLGHPRHWAVLGLLAGLGWWAHRGALLVVPAAVAVGFFDAEWQPRRRLLAAAAAFGAGAAVGCVPFLLGLRQIDQPLYEPVTAGWSVMHPWIRLRETLTGDIWQFLGAYDHRFALPAALLVIGLAILGLATLHLQRNDVFAVGVLVTCWGFWLLSTIAYAGAVRYLVLALPLVYGLAGRGVVRLWSIRRSSGRVLAAGSVILVTVSLYGGRMVDSLDIAAGKGEQHEGWPGGFDPRPALGVIEQEGYRICYADFWIAYKLEFLSTTGVQFIPHRSVDRTQARSLRLAATPGRKCFVEADGTVRELTAAQQAEFRAETIAHAERRARGVAAAGVSR